MKRFDEAAAEAWDKIAGGSGKKAPERERPKAGQAAPRKTEPKLKPEPRRSDPDGLVPHGIYQVHADLQAHVCMRAEMVYWFPVQELLRAIDLWKEQRGRRGRRRHERPPPLLREMRVRVSIDGVERVTARGLLVPVDRIPMLSETPISPKFLSVTDELEPEGTSEKGQLAVDAIVATFKGDVVVFPEGHRNQLLGIDLTVNGVTIEAKYDLPGGRESHGGSGHLFVQTHEINLQSKH